MATAVQSPRPRPAERDPLTGVLSRRAFLAQLEHRLRDGAPDGGRAGALIVLDIDNFQLTNDTSGRAAADEQLRSVARILLDRAPDSQLVGRLDGDEFGALLPEFTERQALAFATELRSRLCERSVGPPVQASVGIALFGTGEELTTDDLLSATNAAIDEVKRAGGDQAAVYRGRCGALSSHVAQVRHALAEQRFVLHAQPILDLRSNRVAARELLIRMLSETGEVIPPGEFMPIAERFSLAGAIDRWVIRESLGLARHESVTVNLSARSIGDPAILRAVRDAVTDGVDPRNLTFEITETAVLTDLTRAQVFVAALRELGCELALDDFGTGFGSFIYLKHLPARYLKIDMEFVRDINDDPTDKEIVRSIVGIAQTLGKETIAEGVESAAVLKTLRELGVDYAQGYYIGSPGPVSQPTIHPPGLLDAYARAPEAAADRTEPGPANDDALALDGNAELAARVEELRQVTERYERLNAELRARELRYRLLFEMNPEPMVVYDRATHRIISANNTMIERYGYSHEELLSMTVEDLVTPGDVDRLVTFLQANFRDEVPVRRTSGFAGQAWQHRYKDGTIIEVEVTSVDVRIEDRVCRFVHYRNVTELNRVADELASARDLAVEASKLKSAFLATMSHELRTPMNGVVGMNELLLGTPLSPEQREYAEQVARSGQEMLAIIDDVLDISRMETGRLELAIADFDVRDTIDAGLRGGTPRCRPPRGCDFEVRVEPGVPTTLRGDGRRVQQVLMNLVANAVKFTDRGGIAVRLHAEPRPGRGAATRCEVTDTGIGIDPSTIERMFEPFTQADPSTTRRHGGAGLGLAIVRDLVRLMGGTISVESEPGRGSTFSFELELQGAEVFGAPGL